MKAQTKRETSGQEPAITKLNINKTQNRPKIWITNKMKRKPSAFATADAESIKTHLQRQHRIILKKKKKKKQSARQVRESGFSDQNHQMLSDDLDRRKLQA